MSKVMGDSLTTELWETMGDTYINLVYDHPHHKSPIAQWLERPTGILKVVVLTPVGGSENYFSEYVDLRMQYS